MNNRYPEIIGNSAAMRRVYRLMSQVCRHDVLVLLTGESGTGKDLVAKAVHENSSRRGGPYYPVNMGAIPKDLIGSTLFGHEKGAFTGATNRKKGLFESAVDGTLFLDEIATMDEVTQVSLLRVLETHTFRRVGGNQDLTANSRIIAATNVDLKRAVRNRTFRADLYHRLNVFSIHLPPLRERRKDIVLLAHHFLKRYSEEFEKQIEGFHPEAEKMLLSYMWPGNVRELEHVMMRAVIMSDSPQITPDLLTTPLGVEPGEDGERPAPEEEVGTSPDPDENTQGSGTSVASSAGDDGSDESVQIEVGTSLEDAERRIIRMTIEKTNGNKGEAAKILGISRKGIYNKLKKYNL